MSKITKIPSEIRNFFTGKRINPAFSKCIPSLWPSLRGWGFQTKISEEKTWELSAYQPSTFPDHIDSAVYGRPRVFSLCRIVNLETVRGKKDILYSFIAVITCLVVIVFSRFCVGMGLCFSSRSLARQPTRTIATTNGRIWYPLRTHATSLQVSYDSTITIAHTWASTTRFLR